jgi:hypothetical protein
MTEYGRIHTEGSRSGGQPLVNSIQEKALALLNEVGRDWGNVDITESINRAHDARCEALCRAVEHREILNAENQQLSHDLERQMTIANEHVNEVERLREALEAAPLIGRTESVCDFMVRQNAWLNGPYRAALEQSK